MLTSVDLTMEYRIILCLLAMQLWNYGFVFGMEDCPHGCSCLSTVVSCTRGNISAILKVLPSWAEDLDLSANNLTDNFTCDLSHLYNLTDLNFSRNAFTTIPTLGYLKNLRKFTLTHNRVGSLKSSLSQFPSLETLNMNNNKLDELMIINFPVGNSIKILHLSNNRIKILHEGAFENLKSLIKLKLNKNKLTNIPKRLFSVNNSLEILELNENSFKEFDALLFKSFNSLKVLKLRGNGMNDLKDGVFYGLKNINTLQLDKNNLTIISKRWLYGLDTLKCLSLGSNAITTITGGCWEFNRDLEELDLSRNQLERISSNTFQHLSSLRVLKLDNNKISNIEENAFTHMPSLEVLELSYNQISWTVEDMNGPFKSLGNLVRFSLANNHIKSVSSKAFRGLVMLTWLDLNNNNIASVQEHAFDSLQNLKELFMNTPSLLCDCKLQWLPQWLKKQTTNANSLQATCAYPAALSGTPVVQVSKDRFTCDNSPTPTISEHPKTQLAIEGNSTHLYCKAVSSRHQKRKNEDQMTFHWRKNTVNITNSRVRYYNSVIRDDDTIEATSELILSNITRSDEGKYQCIVTNSYGTTYSQMAIITVVIPPNFIKRPANITVKTGETAKLECSADGSPSPQIAWRKDGGNDFPAARERRMVVMPTDDVFFIVNSNVSDMGVYSCTAQNVAGIIVSNASLTVLEAPSFVNSMVNKEIPVGDSVVLECRMSGSPKPTLIWLKDGAPIPRTKRHFFTAEDQLLVIVEAVQSDQGLYECVITNSLGTERDSIKLKVLPPVISVVNDEDMMGIIIITVVCCAVGTSIIWVVFIYQTRKRMSSAVPHYQSDSLPMGPLPNTLIPDHTATHIFPDNISERSSCKDSGTGDSAKRSSLEVLPVEEYSQEISRVSVYTEHPQLPLEERHTLLRNDTHLPAVHYYYDENVDCVVNLSSLPRCESPNEIRTFPYS